MAVLNDNNIYFSLGGTDLSAYFTGEVSREVSINMQDITAGAGQDWEQMAAGLQSYSLSLSLVYDIDNVQTILTELNAAKTTAETMVYGPESNASGKPKDEITVLVESISGPNPTIEKDKVQFEVGMVGTDTPTAIIEAGDTFA